jgi:YidC/Oxa1 family membrane protein insertase
LLERVKNYMTNTLVSLLTNLAQCFGGSLGWAIVALSLGIRVAILPLTLRISRRAMRNQALLQAMKPEIDALKERCGKNSQQLFAETQKLYKKYNFSPFDLPAMLGAFIQLPIFSFLYGAIRTTVGSGGRFFWIRNLASPDAALVFLILAITGASAYFLPNASETGKSMLVLIQVIVTGFIIWKLAAGLGLYWAASGLVSLGQNVWMSQSRRLQATA